MEARAVIYVPAYRRQLSAVANVVAQLRRQAADEGVAVADVSFAPDPFDPALPLSPPGCRRGASSPTTTEPDPAPAPDVGPEPDGPGMDF